MNIGMILDNEFNGDMRVENEIISLQNAGYKVYLLCLNHGKKPKEEIFFGASIVRVSLSKFLKNKMKGLCNTFFDFYTLFWGRHLKKFLKKNNISVIHAHDLYMLGSVFYANKRLKQKCIVVADLHENYPEALKNYKFVKTFPGNLIISIPKWMKTEEKWLKKSNHIITVIEEAVERYSCLGISKEKLHVVANYVNEEQFTNKINTRIIEKFENRTVVTYIGGFDIHRGIESVIKAIPLIKKIIPDVLILLVGSGKNENDLRQLALDLKVQNHVLFEGFQDAKSLPSYISVSKVCLIPHLKTNHTDNTIPHKLFHYMFMGKPVLASNCKPLERIINETKAGLVFESGNEYDFFEKLSVIVNNKELAFKMGQNGIKAVKEKYNWNITSENLINLYQNIFKSKVHGL